MVTPAQIVLIIALLLAAVSAAVALPAVIDLAKTMIRRSQHKQLAQGSLADKNQYQLVIRKLAHDGVPTLSLPSRLLLKLTPWQVAINQLALYLQSQAYVTDIDKLSELMLAVCLSVALGVTILTHDPLVSLISVALVPIIGTSQAKTRLARRTQKMREQLPDALQCLGFCFMAGCSLVQAIEQTADESPEPLKTELAQVSDDIHSGLAIGDALAALEQRNSLPEISFISVALEIQHQTGGSLKDLLESAASSVRTAVTLKRQLQAQTAQARLSFKVVALMPLFLVMVLSLTVDGYINTFVSSAEGLTILVVALTMELAGILLVRKILGVDLG
jgi:tight adherence protein B